jgi:hypothetical protein
MTRTRRAFAVALAAVAMTAAATVATALPARADGGPNTTAACPTGYLCIQPALGTSPILVKEGESQEFKGGLPASSFTNLTKLGYCVSGSLNFGIPSGATLNRLTTVTAVAPTKGACLT